MKIAILILNWNGKSLLEQFLPFVLKHSEDHDVFVIDNASEDNSVAFVQDNFPTVKCIKLDQNYGYAEGYNRAISQINSDLLCLLNSDVKVTKSWLKPILQIFKNNRDISIVQPKILDQKKPEKFEYAGAAGGYVDQLGYPYCRGRIFDTVEVDSGQYNKESDIFWASGACFFIRSSVFKSLGGFDPLFFAHMEEIDLCWRAYNNGHRAVFTPESVVFHVGGASLETSNPKKTYYNFRNSLLTLTKNTTQPLFLVIFLRLLLDGVAGLNFIVKGKFRHTFSIIKAHFSYYKLLPKIIHYRKINPKCNSYKSPYSIVWHYFVRRTKIFSKLKRY